MFKVTNPFALQTQLASYQTKLYRHRVELIDSVHRTVNISFVSTQSTNYDLSGIKTLVENKDIETTYSNCSIAGGNLQTAGIVCLEVSSDKLYRVAIGLGDSITETISELTTINSQTTTAL